MPATVKKGSEGLDVRYVQESLDALYWPPGRSDGVFDEATEVAVKMFQRHVGLGIDGIVGTRTYAALERALRETRGRIWGRSGPRRSPVALGGLGATFEGLELSLDDLVVKLGAVEDGVRAQAVSLGQAVSFLARTPPVFLAYLEALVGGELSSLPESARVDAERVARLAAGLGPDGSRRRLGEALEQVAALHVGGRVTEIGTAVRAFTSELDLATDVNAAFAAEPRTLAFELRNGANRTALVATGSGGALRSVAVVGGVGTLGAAELALGGAAVVTLCRGDLARFSAPSLEVTRASGEPATLGWTLDLSRLAAGVSLSLDREKDLSRLVAGPTGSLPGAAFGEANPATVLWP
jgi:hypothetical protein